MFYWIIFLTFAIDLLLTYCIWKYSIMAHLCFSNSSTLPTPLKAMAKHNLDLEPMLQSHTPLQLIMLTTKNVPRTRTTMYIPLRFQI